MATQCFLEALAVKVAQSISGNVYIAQGQRQAVAALPLHVHATFSAEYQGTDHRRYEGGSHSGKGAV